MPIPFSKAASLPNTLLASLPQAEWDLLRPSMRRRYVVAGQCLHEQGGDPEHAFFIEEGIASLALKGSRGRSTVQVAMVGREGLVSGLSLLANSPAATDATMLFPGNVLSIPIEVLLQRMAELPVLKQACMRYLAALITQVIEISADSAQQNLVQRCVRWILMTHDRMGDTDLLVTHETIANLLGVRRPGVTLAMAALQDEGLIHASRGRIRIMKRAGLEAIYGDASAWPVASATAEPRHNRLMSSQLEAPVAR